MNKMSEQISADRFDKSVTLDQIRERVQQFAQERDWDQVHSLLQL